MFAMKKALLYTFVLCSVLAVSLPSLLTASAAYIGKGENYGLPGGRVINDNLYAAGGNVSIMGNVTEDLIALGGTIMVSGDIAKDAVLGAGNVIVQGNVGDDVRAAGGTVVLLGEVGGEAIAAGGQVTLSESAVIAGEFIAAGKMISIDGKVKGGVNVRGWSVTVNGEISGPARIYAEKVVIGESAVLRGGLIYDAPRPAEIEEGADIQGDVVFNEVKSKAGIGIGKRAWLVGLSALWFAKMAMSLALALVLFALFRKQATMLAVSGLKDYGRNVLRGFALVVLLPVGAGILFVTFLGIPLGVIVTLITVLGFICASALAGMMLGSLIVKLVKKAAAYELGWGSVILGTMLMCFIWLIPFVGCFISFAFILAALGTILAFGYKKCKDGK